MIRQRTRTAAGALRALIASPTALVGAVILVVVIGCAIAAPLLMPYGPEEIDLEAKLAGPSGKHWLGTDELGRDTLTRLMYGARVSLAVSATSVLAAAVVGVVLGGLAAVWSRWFQTAVLRLTDIVLSFPEVLLAIVLIAVLGPSMVNVVIAIAVSYAPKFLRLTWSSLLVVREQTYVEAARAAGTGTVRNLSRHMIPNVMPVVLVQVTLSLGYAILVESTLSFLGLGVQPPQASWGSMINNSQLYITQSAWATIFPGLAILLTVLALNFLGDHLAERLDPRLRRGAAGGTAGPVAGASPAAGAPGQLVDMPADGVARKTEVG